MNLDRVMLLIKKMFREGLGRFAQLRVYATGSGRLHAAGERCRMLFLGCDDEAGSLFVEMNEHECKFLPEKYPGEMYAELGGSAETWHFRCRPDGFDYRSHPAAHVSDVYSTL
jgi:hypothetical protein